MAASPERVLDDEPNFIVAARKRARLDPVWFARNILRLKQLPGEPSLAEQPDMSWEMDDWTVELLNAVADIVRHKEGLPTVVNHEGLNQITIRAMHGPGKTFGLALLMHWFGFCFYGKNPCTAPKLEQLKRRLWPEFRKIRRRAIMGYADLTEVQAQAIYWMGKNGRPDPDHWSFMETASTPENLAGLHDRYMLLLVDEATGVDEALWPVIEGAISTGKYVILVIISNPTKLIGTFAASHLKPIVAKHWYRMHISLDKTARVSREWVHRMEDKYGKNSPIVKVRCYGEFADEDSNQLISLGWIDDAISRPYVPDGSIPRQRMSIDVADGGADFTVITHAIHYQSFIYLDKQKEYSFDGRTATNEIVAEAERLWKFYGMDEQNGDDIVVDCIGVGTGVGSNLTTNGYPVVRYKGGAKSDNSKIYRNRRVQSYLVCRDKFREGTLVISDDFVDDDEWDDVCGQLVSIRRKVGMETVEDLVTKEEMKNATLPSPDRADSIAMQFATQSPEMPVGNIADYFGGQQMETAYYDGSIV